MSLYFAEPAPPCWGGGQGERSLILTCLCWREEENVYEGSSPSLFALQDLSSSKVGCVCGGGSPQGAVYHLQGICTVERVDAGGQKPPDSQGWLGEEPGLGVHVGKESPQHLPSIIGGGGHLKNGPCGLTLKRLRTHRNKQASLLL